MDKRVRIGLFIFVPSFFYENTIYKNLIIFFLNTLYFLGLV